MHESDGDGYYFQHLFNASQYRMRMLDPTLSELFAFTVTAGGAGAGTTNPRSTLSIGDAADGSASYLQLDAESGPPPAADCDSDSERGRELYDYTNHRRYTCGGASRGWDYIELTD